MVFTRINPPGEAHAVSRLSADRLPWLPAIEVRGEGIFLGLEEEGGPCMGASPDRGVESERVRPEVPGGLEGKIRRGIGTRRRDHTAVHALPHACPRSHATADTGMRVLGRIAPGKNIRLGRGTFGWPDFSSTRRHPMRTERLAVCRGRGGHRGSKESWCAPFVRWSGVPPIRSASRMPWGPFQATRIPHATPAFSRPRPPARASTDSLIGGS